jgi:hypothetical protein
MGAYVRLQLADPKCQEARSLRLQTPGTWLSGLAAGQAMPQVTVTWHSVCPALGTWAAYLCAGQTKHTRGAWADAYMRNIINLL